MGARRVPWAEGVRRAEAKAPRRLQALSEAGLTPEPDLFAPAHFTIETAQPTVQALVNSGAAFDAVFAASDLIAMTAVQTLNQAGRSVPEQVSVVGFDDIALARHGAPPLTTVRQDMAAGARGMVDLLFRRIEGGAPESVFMAPELIVRQT